jgi:hypothetical protein
MGQTTDQLVCARNQLAPGALNGVSVYLLVNGDVEIVPDRREGN